MFFPSQRTWPPVPGLLSKFTSLFLRDRATWGVDDWKAYAAFLEEQGSFLLSDLVRVDLALTERRRKASRRKLNTTAARPAVRGLLEQRRTPGRKTAGLRYDRAREVIAIQAQLTRAGKPATDRDALAEWLARQGKRRSRVNEYRNILNAISELRRRHKITGR